MNDKQTDNNETPPVGRVPAGAFFEDFIPGTVFRHKRGKTVGEVDVALMAQMTMNSAHGHFNHTAPEVERFGRRLAFGGYTASLVIGLSAQDTAEQAVAELGIDLLKLTKPVFDGDSIHAITEVVSSDSQGRDQAGIVTFRHYGVNQHGEQVCEIVRRVLIRRREDV